MSASDLLVQKYGGSSVANVERIAAVAARTKKVRLGTACLVSSPRNPLYLALAIGCGSKPGPWMNDSGFWVVSKTTGMTEVESLRGAIDRANAVAEKLAVEVCVIKKENGGAVEAAVPKLAAPRGAFFAIRPLLFLGLGSRIHALKGHGIAREGERRASQCAD